jgi:hypothetical protein
MSDASRIFGKSGFIVWSIIYTYICIYIFYIVRSLQPFVLAIVGKIKT